MKTTITVPQKESEQQVLEFRLNPGNRHVIVTVRKADQTTRVQVDLLPLLKNATTTQKNVIKGFFKLVGVEALKLFNEGVTLTADDLTGELFDESEPEPDPEV